MFRPAFDSAMKVSLSGHYPDPRYFKYYLTFTKGSYDDVALFYNYPFTGLGYTWDYNPESKDHFGVTEFVVKENRLVLLKRKVNFCRYWKEIVKRKADQV